ncbi:hypothetical protein AMJ44_11030 [candidate division WOR-1 bacterium DG_54_3]|uniref:Uncharacterized protein n=1 Tax=candidate division WOR-1 bacterium DG_54_3 TaxID=1703775 RepID=A0A0S7XTA7_UNCSA|nr:MAG: hypothetical protein AMJ44_11030 [candidate division WOR-1 bacterium DG_54_3]
MNILVDHTSFHTLNAGPHQSRPASAVLGILQFFEELLLSQTVWFADTEGTRTLSGTQRVVDALQNVGLANSTNTGLVRRANFSPESFRNVIQLASNFLSNHLVLPGPTNALISDLRERGQVDAGPLRPAGVLPIDFHELLRKIGQWSSENREEVIQQAVVDREFNSTVSPFLVSEPLFTWLEACLALVPEPDDPVYNHLVTLARLSINRSLAASISKEVSTVKGGHLVIYAPAYARAKALAANYLPPTAVGLYFLREKLPELYGKAQIHKSPISIPYSTAFTMPVLGAWLMLSLPSDATLPDYLAEIAEKRESRAFVALRCWLAGEPSAEEIDILISKVQRRLKVPRHSPTRATTWAELSMTRPPNVGIKVERDVSTVANLSMRRCVRSRRTGSTVALLTGCLDTLLKDASIADDLVTRTQRLLESSGLTRA